MFFTTDDGVNVIQFGTGDIRIAPGILVDEAAGSISLIPDERHPINSRDENLETRYDIELGVHTRLVFTDVRSIDVLIDMLYETRDLMGSGLPGSEMGTPRKIIVYLLLKLGNTILWLSDYCRK
jgi:hypothetical protein